ncbi:MAG TPA: LON peptidase substrate-binding domain-containing protein, partial [Isosphaeraceae bacterium]|nr:LON peptidase substrate-binding domain-containing protein [Isosphaeraceae bacterium]
MQDDLDLRDFDGVTRLFPLAGVVMFPHVVLPLHIFEPRYRQMTRDAL